MKSSQRCLCINAAVRNHFLRLSARVFFFCLFVLFSFENAHFPLRSLISVRKITNWPMKSSHRCLCIKAAVRNHFFRLSERDFLFYSCLKNGLSAIWKRKFFLWGALFQLKKNHTCWPKKSSQKYLCIEATVRNK